MTIGAAALSLSPSSVSALPATTTATLSGFTASETVTFRLDSPSGTVLATSPATTTTSAAGAATATVTIPSSTSTGAHTIHAIAADGLSATATLTVSLPAASLSLTSTTFATLPAHDDGDRRRVPRHRGDHVPARLRERHEHRHRDRQRERRRDRLDHRPGRARRAARTPSTPSARPARRAIPGRHRQRARRLPVRARLLERRHLASGGPQRHRDDDARPRAAAAIDLLGLVGDERVGSTTGTVRIFTPAGGRNTLEVTAMTGCTSFAVGSIDLGRTNMTSSSGTVLTYTATIAWSRTSRRVTITLTSNATATGGSLTRIPSGNTAVATLTPSRALRALSGAAVTGTFSTGAIVPF